MEQDHASNLNWNVSEDEGKLIARIAAKYAFVKSAADPDYRRHPGHIIMDIAACHLNGCPLDLQALYNADGRAIVEDVDTIFYRINRDTGKMPAKAEYRPKHELKGGG